MRARFAKPLVPSRAWESCSQRSTTRVWYRRMCLGLPNRRGEIVARCPLHLPFVYWCSLAAKAAVPKTVIVGSSPTTGASFWTFTMLTRRSESIIASRRFWGEPQTFGYPKPDRQACVRPLGIRTSPLASVTAHNGEVVGSNPTPGSNPGVAQW